jgi:type 1 fimbria pilin
MKSNGIKIITLIVILFVSLISFANNGNKLTADQRATIKMQKVNTVCNLNQQQQVQVKQFYLNSINNINERKSERKNLSKSDRIALRKSSHGVNSPYQNSLKEILTPSQLLKWNNSEKKK